MPIPGIVQLVNNVMISFIYVDIFMSDEWLPQTLYGTENLHEDNEPLNSFFDENGYSSKSLLKTIGSAMVFLGFYVFLWVLLGILWVLGLFSKISHKCYVSLRNKLLWKMSLKIFES